MVSCKDTAKSRWLPLLTWGPETLENEGIINSNVKGQLLNIPGPLINDGLVEATDGGKMDLAGPTGDGQFLIGQAATLELGGLTAQAVTFESGGGGGGTLYLDNATDFSGTVTGLGQADSIDLADFAFSSHPVITNVTGTGAAGSTTDVTIADGPLTTTFQLLNQYAGEYPTASTAYYLKSDNAGPGTLFATVVNPALTVLASVRATEGVTTGTVATFTDANPNATASDFTATINWGDGTTTTGTVVAQNGGGFAVDGTHTYADEGKYTVDVTINDVGGSTASATSTRRWRTHRSRPRCNYHRHRGRQRPAPYGCDLHRCQSECDSERLHGDDRLGRRHDARPAPSSRRAAAALRLTARTPMPTRASTQSA